MSVELGKRRGMTLVEVLVAAAICSVLLVLIGMMLISLLGLTDTQTRLVNANQQGMKAIDDIGRLLNDAILPIRVESVREPAPGQQSAWDDVDSPERGFGGANSATNTGDRWRQALIAGVDNLAFTQVVQVLGSVHDNRYDKEDPAYSDSSRASRVLLGQVRGSRGYLGAGIVNERINPVGKYRFDFHDDASNEPVNILARVDPEQFNSPMFEMIAVPTANDWRTVTLSSYNFWPNRTAFMAIRYLPRMDPGTGAPWRIAEQNAFRGGAIDLDGDGRTDGVFNVGKLQLVYSGGSDLYTENNNGTGLETASLEQVVIDLTADIVLRNDDRNLRVPIFQLVDPNPAGQGSRQDGDVGSYLRVRLLLVDNSGVDNDGLMTSPHAETLLPRWYETGIFMNNMRR